MTRFLRFGQKKARSVENRSSPPVAASDNDSVEDISGLSNLYSPQEDTPTHVRDVVDVLSEMGIITTDQLSGIRQLQVEKPGCEITQIIRELKLADETVISMAKANLYGFKFHHVEPQEVDREAFDKLELNYIKSNHIIPVGIQGQTLIVATSRPADLFVIEDVKRQTQMNVEVLVCPDEDINKACDVLEKERIGYGFDDAISDMADVEVVKEQKDDLEDLEKMAGQSPVIKFVNYLISNAIREGA
ncbi:MAG: GspE/PulE/PilB domain-containing protein, partial [Planctomycetota bacterium]